ncbi:MAG: hypothetical protein IT349_19280 [Candidatus Eisenbacteria bacterium]|nr:hypothetical protein [Candidatus Eisenbacteria bacterium]
MELVKDKEIKSALNLPAPRVHRVMVNVKRGPTDETPYICFRHEIPILEEVFGEGNVVEVTDTDPDGRKLMRAAMKAKGPVVFVDTENAEGDTDTLAKHYDPSEDPREEYNRLAQVYGMHRDVNMSVVEKVYGQFREGRFTAAVMGGRFSAKPKGLSEEDVQGMKGPEIQQKLAELGVDYDPAASVKSLRAQLIGALSST